jgi:N-glycosylase/DNA lyase
MLKIHKCKLIEVAAANGYTINDTLTIAQQYESALSFVHENIDISSVETITANRIVIHAIDNTYIDYQLPKRGKEWYQGNIPYCRELGYLHYAVDDDLKVYLITQESE